MSRYALGIDIGGTFTDVVLYDREQGRRLTRKALTTPGDPAEAVLDAVDQVLRDEAIPSGEVERVVHATTLFTNALIEHKGARTALLTTDGFRDSLEIGRERKYDLYDLAAKKPRPLVARDLRFEAQERILADGRILTPLNSDALADIAAALQAADVTSLAIVFLHSYRNDTHERAAGARIEELLPDLAISLSSDVAPEIREFERASTTVANAYIKPLARDYLDALSARLGQREITAPLLLMLSSGGLTHVGEVHRSPVQMLESGPAAGALAAADIGRAEGLDHVLAFDMGGTTAKLCLIDGEEPAIAYRFEAARERRFAEGSGLPIRISTVELIEIGAGGGSIARLDALGLLKAGPDSAGAVPGPVAYGRGGTEPTITDADFALGFLSPIGFAGGAIDVDIPASQAALDDLAQQAGLSSEKLAWGIHDLVNENMASAARVHVAEKGRDPRNYTLVPTGGAGPVHAYYLARKLGIKRIVCPRNAGVASALGLLLAPARVDRTAAFAAAIDDLDWAELETTYQDLESAARQVIVDTGMDSATARVQRLADMRNVGQGFELVVNLPTGPYSGDSHDGLLAAYAQAYQARFTRPPPNVPVTLAAIRVRLTAPVDTSMDNFDQDGASALKGQREVYFPETDGVADAAIYNRAAMKIGDVHTGPAVVEEAESTMVIGPGGKFHISANGNLIIDLPKDTA
ncbi:MAG: hydantoinase/oxoprolinase family protein [Rhodospirillaceae bacterium]|jgi:N-methylhydantoinase A|nr:hydantoinase/oxoprolinase family protein [Rhodospirillaceae bacterium]MBT4689874.1 hydantoinase/oxoprolinase family protein [Rhodospirillaceae bacterium]MBT5083691.1 hydantoinase/oxoprolinase family protein [Rhodospirillaceae bacterium]MBT5522567.1 hydantoinase/oxoprolinase family protein [Rhodospirillaceae bacterium]MBT5878611.1 hydantoinase/oxoprolinase family protein [Rhodospirillaceae bacterium]